MKSALAKASNLQQRMVGGVLGALVFVGSLLWDEWTYAALFGVLLLLGLLEFYRLINTLGYRPHKFWGITTGLSLYTLSFFRWRDGINEEYFYLLYALGGAVFIHELFRKKEHPFINIAFTLLGVLYIAMPLSLLHDIAFFGGPYHFQLVLSLFLLIWASDTGAYVAGKNFGRNKLFERISPGKTWEGFWGGLLTSVLVSIALSHFFTDLVLIEWILMALIVSIFGTLGDLVESMLKRNIGIKDSGNFLPGHGGVLDRFDALFLAVPFVVVLLKFF